MVGKTNAVVVTGGDTPEPSVPESFDITIVNYFSSTAFVSYVGPNGESAADVGYYENIIITVLRDTPILIMINQGSSVYAGIGGVHRYNEATYDHGIALVSSDQYNMNGSGIYITD